MGHRRIDTKAIGLDVGLSFAKWLTGMENLHYGDWTGLEVCAANTGRAQVAYTDRLFTYLPDGPCRILDIGGGAGETARKLIALGHSVEIVVPSAFLAERCRENAPGAVVHEMMFEEFASEPRFDLCLFSESYQYIPLDEGLPKCLSLLEPGGRIVIADCFRTPAYRPAKRSATVGGGHREAAFREMLETQPVKITFEEDITASVAPSVDLEQALFNVFGHAATRIDGELAEKRPRLRWVIRKVWNMFVSERKRARLDERLNKQTRNAEAFCTYNRYLMMVIEPA